MTHIRRMILLTAIVCGAWGVADAGAATLEDIQAPPDLPSLETGPPPLDTPLPSLDSVAPPNKTPLPAMDLGPPSLDTPLPSPNSAPPTPQAPAPPADSPTLPDEVPLG